MANKDTPQKVLKDLAKRSKKKRGGYLGGNFRGSAKT